MMSCSNWGVGGRGAEANKRAVGDGGHFIMQPTARARVRVGMRVQSHSITRFARAYFDKHARTHAHAKRYGCEGGGGRGRLAQNDDDVLALARTYSMMN